ncbi:MAG: pseudaminic acid cytidylyltransferase [Deltaproteobacteria bacterium]|nr:pseudaminic acid cytidylyltransferase [Deltaproteobacteria bacterium]
MRLAIIPARGGSKRIPRKNIKPFLGKPILAYSIAAARASGCFDTVMVSTDDEEIATVARAHGAEVPFLRDAETASDTATTAAVLLEVLQRYCAQGEDFAQACCIYPTAPFVTAEKLRGSLTMLTEGAYDSVISMVRYSFPIQRALERVGERVAFVSPEFALSRSQDLAPRFHDAGQWYWFDVPTFEREKRLFSANTAGYELSELEVQDIDSETDWQIAELKCRYALGQR